MPAWAGCKPVRNLRRPTSDCDRRKGPVFRTMDNSCTGTDTDTGTVRGLGFMAGKFAPSWQLARASARILVHERQLLGFSRYSGRC